jgi:hypothetical protein
MPSASGTVKRRSIVDVVGSHTKIRSVAAFRAAAEHNKEVIPVKQPDEDNEPTSILGRRKSLRNIVLDTDDAEPTHKNASPTGAAGSPGSQSASHTPMSALQRRASFSLPKGLGPTERGKEFKNSYLDADDDSDEDESPITVQPHVASPKAHSPRISAVGLEGSSSPKASPLQRRGSFSTPKNLSKKQEAKGFRALVDDDSDEEYAL